MKEYQYHFSVIGNDLRMAFLARRLAGDGYRVCVFGLAGESAGGSCQMAETLISAAAASRIVIGPVPFDKESQGAMAVSVVETMKSGQFLLAGCISSEIRSQLAAKGIPAFDYMEETEVIIFNSIATAEGMIAEAILNYPSNLHESRAIVLGFGHCAKTLALKLKGLVDEVAVCARSVRQRAEAQAFGMKAFDFDRLPEEIAGAGLVFNSIPALVLDDGLLGKMSSGAMIFDMASRPGGVDFAAAKERHIFAKLCPGLPGKYSPKSSGEALAAYAVKTANELGVNRL